MNSETVKYFRLLYVYDQNDNRKENITRINRYLRHWQHVHIAGFQWIFIHCCSVSFCCCCM